MIIIIEQKKELTSSQIIYQSKSPSKQYSKTSNNIQKL